VGELVQTDASPFDWLGQGIQYALHGFQDDAAGDILGLYLCEHECLQGYFEAFRAVLQGYGAPQATKRLIHDSFFANLKALELAGKGKIESSVIVGVCCRHRFHR
jgi:hypothetical protein